MMKTLLFVTAILELGAGLALECCPSTAVALLLGSPPDAPAAVTLGRLAGVALFALGAACWFACRDAPGRAAKGMIAAMTAYNLGAVIVLSAAGLQLQPVGVVLWPAVILHAAMTVWCFRCLVRKPARIAELPPSPSQKNHKKTQTA
jgi:hypothetical protein